MTTRTLTISGIAALVLGLLWLGGSQIKLTKEVHRLNADLAAETAKRGAGVSIEQYSDVPTAPPKTVRIAGAESAGADRVAVMQKKLNRMNEEVGQLRNTVAQLQAQTSGRWVENLGGSIVPIDSPFGISAGLPTGRRWGEEQVLGEPNTLQYGDVPTAWAPKEQDAGTEWLQVDFDKSVPLSEINVHESLNPGAISQVAVMMPDGSERVIWEGQFETGDGAPSIVERAFQVDEEITAGSVRIYMDTTRVSGWNEIDAVELVGGDDSRQWASGATASSTYAQ